ncbi:MAG: hypothetical protein KDA79_11905 [Planctomycetaceae bacterium]|nr:hypothetical protein [Planctomycetaceae bacterium]
MKTVHQPAVPSGSPIERSSSRTPVESTAGAESSFSAEAVLPPSAGSAAAASDSMDQTATLMLRMTAVCQAVTLLLTWQAWEFRQSPLPLPLPMLGLAPDQLPAWSFGVPLLASLVVVFFRPHVGVLLHALVFAISCFFDQYRMQPQVISLLVLMAGCLNPRLRWGALWYLAAMWFWAGLHKLLSPEWLGPGAWWFLQDCGLPADSLRLPFAIGVAVAEIALGVLVVVRPRMAARGAVLLHAGILFSLVFLRGGYNVSVWPWNIATAAVGGWMLWQKQELTVAPARLRFAVPAVLLIMPAGFYLGLVNPHLACVLYSGNMPRAVHTTWDGPVAIQGWTGLRVPFPESPRLALQAFRQSARPGEKLFTGDPRPGMRNHWYLCLPDGQVQEISQEQFLAGGAGSRELPGIETADPVDLWNARRSGAQLTFDNFGLPHGVRIRSTYAAPNCLALVSELASLRELTLDDATLTEDDVNCLARLRRLSLLQLNRSQLRDEQLGKLQQQLPACRIIQSPAPVLSRGDRSWLAN